MNKRTTWGLRLVLAVVVAGVLAACGNTTVVQPKPFTFTAVTDAEPGADVTSNTVTITGNSVPLDAKVTPAGAILLINGTPAAANPKVKPNDKIAVRVKASSEPGGKVTATVTVGTVSGSFSVTTREASTTPDPFEFTAVTGAEPNASVTSGTVTLSGFEGSLPAEVTGGTLIVNGAEAAAPADVQAGDEIALRVTASGDYEATTSATVTIGTESATFSVTTRAASTTPNAFVFSAVTGAELNDDVPSNAVTLAGFDGTLQADVTGGTLIVNGVPATTPVDVEAGDEIAVVVTSSGAYETETTATVTVGTVSATFSVTTKASPVAPAITSFTASAAEATPGQSVTLSWTITGDFDLVELAGPGITGAQDVTAVSSAPVAMPGNQPLAEYTLTASNSELAVSDSEPVQVSIPLWVCDAAGQTVTIADAALEQALRDYVVIIPASGPITCAMMQTITSFDSNNYDGNEGTIASIVGLQHAVNLTNLNLQYNQVSDLSPIANLPLEVINFDRNLVTDLSPIAGITTLEEVGFWDNGPTPGTGTDGISDISALAGLTNLEVVYLSDNNISDLSALSGLSNLTILYAIGNNISDLGPLAGLTNLRSLRVGYQQVDGSITSIASLAGLTQLSWVELQFTRVSDLSPIDDKTRLHAVNLEGMSLQNANVMDLLNNLAFPDATVVPADLGVGAPATPTLALADNCINTLDGPTVIAVAGLTGRGVTVSGFTPPEQALCLMGGASVSSLRDASLNALRSAGGYR